MKGDHFIKQFYATRIFDGYYATLRTTRYGSTFLGCKFTPLFW